LPFVPAPLCPDPHQKKMAPARVSSAPGPSLGNVAISRRTATFSWQLITFGIAPLFNFAH
jgi:hypothetical protein